MVNDSDTESEPESSLPSCSPTDFVQAHKVRGSQQDDGANSAQNAAGALEALRSLNLEIVQNVCSFIQSGS
jgi:hypothetical protein